MKSSDIQALYATVAEAKRISAEALKRQQEEGRKAKVVVVVEEEAPIQARQSNDSLPKTVVQENNLHIASSLSSTMGGGVGNAVIPAEESAVALPKSHAPESNINLASGKAENNVEHTPELAGENPGVVPEASGWFPSFLSNAMGSIVGNSAIIPAQESAVALQKSQAPESNINLVSENVEHKVEQAPMLAGENPEVAPESAGWLPSLSWVWG